MRGDAAARSGDRSVEVRDNLPWRVTCERQPWLLVPLGKATHNQVVLAPQAPSQEGVAPRGAAHAADAQPCGHEP